MRGASCSQNTEFHLISKEGQGLLAYGAPFISYEFCAQFTSVLLKTFERRSSMHIVCLSSVS